MSQPDPCHCAHCNTPLGCHDPGGVVMGTRVETGKPISLRFCWSCWPPDETLRRWREQKDRRDLEPEP